MDIKCIIFGHVWEFHMIVRNKMECIRTVCYRCGKVVDW